MRIATCSSMLTTVGFVGVLTSATPVSAQEVKGGFSLATINFSPGSGSPELSETQQLTGFVAGVSFLLARSDRGGLQVEALLHQKGARNLLRFDDELRLTYLEFPVLLHFDIYQHDPRAVYFVVGPAFAFNTHASYSDDGEKEDAGDEIADFDIGLAVGAGVELRRLTLEARYTWGLRSAFQDGDLEGSFKNRSFTLTAGFRWGR